MQLYVLGPAFGLPSIDAECISTIAFLQSLKGDNLGIWTLIPTHEDSSSHQLPLLIDGNGRITGFRAIVRHLANRSPDLDVLQKGDSTAVSSFIESNAQTLLDLSLYVAFENYRLTTRPAFTAILPWHINYIIPPKRHAAARARTDHLGVSSIDIDTVHDDLSNKPSGQEQRFEPETQKRASLLLRQKDTIRSLLQRPEHAAAFKLKAIADNFFGPLQDMLGDRTYLLGTDRPAAVDSLAYGYLSLMLYPKVPQDWLASTMRQKYNSLVRYTERLAKVFNMTTRAADVMSLAKCKTDAEIDGRRRACKMALPWRPPQQSTVVGIAASIAHDVITRVPSMDHHAPILSSKSIEPSLFERCFPALLTVTTASVALLSFFAFKTELLVWPHGEQEQIFGRKRFTDYGEAGAALSALGLLGGQMGRQYAFEQQTFAEQRGGIESPMKVDVVAEGEGGL